MLTEICAETRNYFLMPNGIYRGVFTVSNNTLAPLSFLKDGQYFRIVGSIFNDGVYKYPATNLTDETFEGSIWAMAVPPNVVALSEKIKDWVNSDEGKPSPYTSESFGGYSYTKATDANGQAPSWKTVFASELNQFRRVSVL